MRIDLVKIFDWFDLRYRRKHSWHTWFAWYPVLTGSKIVWFSYVYRTKNTYDWGYHYTLNRQNITLWSGEKEIKEEDE